MHILGGNISTAVMDSNISISKIKKRNVIHFYYMFVVIYPKKMKSEMFDKMDFLSFSLKLDSQ